MAGRCLPSFQTLHAHVVMLWCFGRFVEDAAEGAACAARLSSPIQAQNPSCCEADDAHVQDPDAAFHRKDATLACFERLSASFSCYVRLVRKAQRLLRRDFMQVCERSGAEAITAPQLQLPTLRGIFWQRPKMGAFARSTSGSGRNAPQSPRIGTSSSGCGIPGTFRLRLFA